MNFRTILVMSGITVLSVLTAFIVCAAQPDLHSPKSNSLSTAPTVCPDEGAQNGFRDPLNTPAETSPLAVKSVLNDIALAGDRLVAVGVRGHILYSDDNGRSWSQSSVPVSVDLTAVDFPTPNKGWAVGHDGVVLHSTDGGVNWVKQLDGCRACGIMKTCYIGKPVSPRLESEVAEKLLGDVRFIVDQGPVNPFLDVWFENESSGYIVGAFNLIFHTQDGGNHWQPLFDRTENPLGLHLYAIQAVGHDIYIAGEQGLVLKRDPADGRFKAVTTPYAGTYFGIAGAGDATLVYGMRGNLYRRQDDGDAWTQISTAEKFGILGSAVTKNGTIVLVSQAGQVLMSDDDGMHFRKLKRSQGTGAPLHAVVAAGPKTLVFAGWFGIEREVLP